MRVETLLSPGLLSNGINLRNTAAKAISSVEIAAGRAPTGTTLAAKTLQDFFTDCATQLDALVDVTPPTVFLCVANSITEVEITFTEEMDKSVTPAAAAFSTSIGCAVDSVAWNEIGNLVLTGTSFAAGDTIVYVAPGTNKIRDANHVLLAGFSEVLPAT